MHLLLDIDGTVIDHRRRVYGLYRKYCQANGVPHLDEPEYFERKSRGQSERAVVRETFPVQVIDQYLDWKLERIEAPDALRDDVLVDGMKTALSELARSHVLVAVSARQSNDVLIAQLAELGIGPLFRTSLPVGSGPPVEAKASAIDAYLSEVEIRPADVTLVGDTEIEVAVASRVGIQCISVAWGLRSGSFLLAHGATAVVESPEELVRIVL